MTVAIVLAGGLGWFVYTRWQRKRTIKFSDTPPATYNRDSGRWER